jgi:hypothetical protein
MTHAPDRWAPGSPGRPALARCINVPVDDFAVGYWGRAALLSPVETLPGDFSDLLDLPAVDELLSRRGLRTPFLRLAKDGQVVPTGRFTRGGGAGAAIGDQVADDRVLDLVVDGSTVVLQGLHRTWPPLVDFATQLAVDLGHPVQVNAYVTPPQSQGFSPHYDVHDVFVLQVAGEKHWTIHEPVLEAPLRDQPWTDRRDAVRERAAEPPVIDAVLRPGDALYLPRGYLHSARALGGVSAHLTVGVHAVTRYTRPLPTRPTCVHPCRWAWTSRTASRCGMRSPRPHGRWCPASRAPDRTRLRRPSAVRCGRRRARSRWGRWPWPMPLRGWTRACGCGPGWGSVPTCVREEAGSRPIWATVWSRCRRVRRTPCGCCSGVGSSWSASCPS